ncbi:porin family protein [Labrys sp. KNU-23]|uniref:outer membrane protein n=1 Tax=Labrys sp. KNU-23 TaxID=2789216 RepID=UPI0011EEB8D6|nr:outer membrane protein [Labrys sp. KNU-23]QEN90103.1 porin family protein [Labrys sp. KNU-23]
MKKIVLAALFLVPMPALAADLAPAPVEPIVPVTPFSWTGFYVGAHIGYGWGREKDDLSRSTPVPADNFNVNGVLGGLHAGYNEQFSNNIVVGLEGDIDLSSIKGSHTVIDAQNGNSRLHMTNRWQGSVRARLGYAFDRILVYATGGVAFGDIRERWNLFDGDVVGSSTKTKVGWTAGAGVEYAFTDNWIGRVEVRYTDFGKSRFRVAPDTRFKAGFHETVAMVGISYKF